MIQVLANHLRRCLVVPGEYVGTNYFPFWMNEVTCSSGSPLTRIRIQRARVGISRLLRVYLKHLRLVAHIELVRRQSTLLLGCRLLWAYAKIFEEGTSIVILEMILYGDHSYDWWVVMTQGVPAQLCTPNSVPMVFIVFSDGILGDYNP